ncbi:hypothetical protein [Enterococcus sp. DIV0170]|uniref:hypothetical protein n=1 Tax=Enterococcus sp. DIV0170 TaxID=2774642 RepID=UPI003F23CFFF
MDHDLNGMKLLVFAPAFFGYEKAIVKKLQSMGAQVTFFDERPSNSTFGKTLVRMSNKLSQGMVYRYYKNIFFKIKEQQFDQILFFQAEATPRWFLEFVNKENKESRKILYLWDSVSDKPMSLDDRDLYDEIFTFDPYDWKEHGLKFRPLFYIDEYLKNPDETNQNYKYDFSFIGTVRKDRFDILQEIRRSADIRKQNYFIFYYLQSKLMYYYFKYIRRDFKNGNISDFSFKPMNHHQIQEIIAQTRVLIDIQKPHQVGLTIRTIELLASNKKFVTTNNEIKKYNFFSDKNIQLLSRVNPCIDNDMIISDFEIVEPDILEQYSIGFFLKELLGFVPSGKYYNN